MSTVLKNTTMLLLLNVSKIIFPLLTLPYLTRVLTVECFGTVAFVKALMQYMQIFADFGFTLSGTKDIVLASEDKEKLSVEVGNILSASCIINFLGLVVVLVLCFYIPLLENYKSFTLLSFFVVFLSSFFMEYLFRGLEIMEYITIRFIVMKSIASILTFIFIKSDADILWIPILDIIGSLVAVVLVYIQIRNIGIRLKVSSIRTIIKKIKNSTVFFVSDVSTTAFGALNTLVVGMYLTGVEVSYWALCQQLVAGVQSLYTPITRSIFPEMVRSKDINLVVKIVKISFPILVFGCLFTYFIADTVIIIVAGMQYLLAAEVLQYLIPVMFFGFFSMIFGWPVLGAFGKQKEVTKSTIFAALFQIFCMFLLVLLDCFTLINLALLRGLTELMLFLFRYIYYKKYIHIGGD